MRQSVKPLIGINTDLRISPKGRASHSVLHSGYYDSVVAAGAVPIILPPLTKEAEMRHLFDRLDGLILTDGDDLDPKRMGLAPHAAVRRIAPRREDADRLLCRMASERKLPLLGVGVGMHLINVLFGGTLYMHLPEDLPRALPHRDPLGGSHRHAIEITPGTRMDEIYGGGEIRVNSSHHQAVRRVSNKFRVSALAPDGVIEAIESADPDWYCIGVQWRPESETASALDMQLFESLANACTKQVKLMAA